MKPTTEISKILPPEDIEWFQSKTRGELEIVVTRFQEDLHWLRGLEHLTIVYNKGEPLPFPHPALQELQTPNYGAGLETMLRHIITNYSSLAPITFFAQGNIADRSDQPLFPLKSYFDPMPIQGVQAYKTDAYDKPSSRYSSRLSNPSCSSIQGRTFAQWREQVTGIPYKYLQEFWVRGDWISVTANTIRRHPRSYYQHLYHSCQFQRGIFVEECWFLERSWYSIFTRKLPRSFQWPTIENVLL